MKAYIITIIGAALLSVMAEIISPGKWRGYVKIITGFVIICCIFAPLAQFRGSDIFSGFDAGAYVTGDTENLQTEIVYRELEKRINADIEKRLKDEYGISASAKCSLKVSEDGEFKGVKEIYIYGARLTDQAVYRLCEVYGIGREGVHNG